MLSERIIGALEEFTDNTALIVKNVYFDMDAPRDCTGTVIQVAYYDVRIDVSTGLN